MNFQMFKLDLQKAEEPEVKLPTLLDHKKASVFQKNIYFCFMDYSKAFDCVAHNKLLKIIQEMRNTGPHLPAEKSVCRSRSNN